MANNHITGSGAVSAGGLLATGAVGLCGLGPTALLRRVAAHEAGHVVAGRACGLPVDGVTVDPAVAGPGLAGRAWGPNSRDCKLLAEMSDVPLCEQVRPLMPAIGDDKNIAAEVYAATHARTVELLAGGRSRAAAISRSNAQRCDLRHATGVGICQPCGQHG